MNGIYVQKRMRTVDSVTFYVFLFSYYTVNLYSFGYHTYKWTERLYLLVMSFSFVKI